MEPRKSSVGWLLMLLISVLVLSGAWLYTGWRSSLAVLPPGLTINGLPMTGMTRAQALNAIAMAYTIPVTVTYAGEMIPPLLPEMIELSVDLDKTAANLDRTVEQRASARDFLRYVAGVFVRQELEIYPVNAVVNYSRERVDAFLARTAQKYDHPTQAAVVLAETGAFRPARGGTELDVAASLPLLINAILAANPSQRQVDLVVRTEPAPPMSMEILQQALSAALGDFSGVAGIFAKDLSSGQELCLNCQTAFSELSMLRVAIALKAAQVSTPLNGEMASLVSAALTESDAAAADALLARLGASDPARGALEVTAFLRALGFQRSFLAAPYTSGEDTQPVAASPADDAPAMATDPLRQTTPMDMGLLLEGLHQCATDGGFLRVLYPQEITPAECQEILDMLQRARARAALGAGLPEGTRLAYQHGWLGPTHAEIALMFGRRTDVALAVFLYQPVWLTPDESLPTFSAIGQVVLRLFDGDR